VIFRTDIIRKELFDNPAHTNEEDSAVYEEMFRRAEKLDSKNIVLDATFRKDSNREKAKMIAATKKTGCIIIYVTCSKNITDQRIKYRKDRYSDFRPDYNVKYNKGFDTLKDYNVAIDNKGTVEELRNEVKRMVLGF
jgi:predicted kinase